MLENFFLFFTDINHMVFPVRIFEAGHFFLLFCSTFYIYCMLQRYAHKNPADQKLFVKRLGWYFLLEELLYTIWVFITCKQNAILEVVPLQLCSLCVYMNVLTIYLKKDYLKFFCAIITTTAGLIAMVYPANLDIVYPIISYRTINFYILHATFIVFGFIQMKELKELRYHFVKQNMVVLSIITCLAYIFNSRFHTDFMFIGAPPRIAFIHTLYQATGILFLPVVLMILLFIQLMLIFIYRFGLRMFFDHASRQ